MSGPIVRKYGFPNFEKIFGPRPILHGEPEASPAPEPQSAQGTAAGESGAPRASQGTTSKSEKAPKSSGK